MISIPLNDGHSMPALGLGTSNLSNEDSMVHAMV